MYDSQRYRNALRYGYCAHFLFSFLGESYIKYIAFIIQKSSVHKLREEHDFCAVSFAISRERWSTRTAKAWHERMNNDEEDGF